MKLSILIPAFNEEATIEQIIVTVQAMSISPWEKELIIIDDGSSDGTVQKIQKYLQKEKNNEIIFLKHKKNSGKGTAIHSGIEKASGDYIIIQDADLEYDPKFIPMLLEPILRKKAEVVYGTRLKRLPNLLKDEKTPLFLLHFIGNRLLSLLTSILYGQWLTDMETGYKVFSRKAVHDMKLKARSFDFEPEITAKLLKKGYKITEIQIKTVPRGYDKGKKLVASRDGFIALWTLVKYRFTN